MMNHQEIEVKFFLNDLKSLENKLKTLGAKLTQSKTHEFNLRFDTPKQELTREHRVLRLRRDTHNILTYKAAAENNQSVSVRTEIEFEVSDFNSAKAFLEALGYQVSVFYEKFRTVYQLADSLVTLDEMPYGNFAEIEGINAASIQEKTQLLKLNWNARSTESYMSFFTRLKEKHQLKVKNLSFDEWAGLNFKAEDFGLIPADE